MTELISSLQNPLVKLAVALRQKKRRDEEGLFCVEGVRACEDFAASDWTGEVCLHTADMMARDRSRAILERMADRGIRLTAVTDAVFAKVSETEQPQGILVLARQRRITVEAMVAGKKAPLLLVMDGIQDPGNVGTMIRTADAAAWDGIILLSGSADPYGGKTVRATMGSLFHLPVAHDIERSELLATLGRTGIPLGVTALEAAEEYHRTDYSGPLALVFGNEGQGVGDDLMQAAARRITIPIFGRAESLNVASAAAVILYEAARQRQANL